MSSPKRSKIIKQRIWDTPSMKDFIFFEDHSSDSPITQTSCLEYGTAHPDAENYPNHVLTYVAPETILKGGKKMIRLFYGADRENQHLYNYRLTGTQIHGYPSYIRYELIKREDFNESDYVIGSADPNQIPGVDYEYPYLLYDYQIQDAPKELNSTYILVQTQYFQPSILEGLDYDEKRDEHYTYYETIVLTSELEGKGNGYPFTSGPDWEGEDGTVYQRQPINYYWTKIRTRRAYEEGFTGSFAVFPTPSLRDYIFYDEYEESEKPADFDTREYGTPHPDTDEFPHHVLVFIDKAKLRGNGKITTRYFYAADRENQHLYNFEYLGNSSGEFETYRRDFLIRREDYDDEMPIRGSFDPHELTPNSDSTRFVVYDMQMMGSGSQELDSIYVMLRVIYIKPSILVNREWDDNTKGYKYSYRTIRLTSSFTGANQAYPFDSSPVAGFIYGHQASNNHWSMFTKTQSGYVGTISYTTYMNYSWPPVMTGYRHAFFPSVSGDSLKHVFRPRFKEGYSGPTRAVHTITYSSGAQPTPDTPDPPMIPESINVHGPVANFSVRSCLHQYFPFQEEIGLTWNSGDFWYHPPTNYTDWPDSLLIKSDVTPHGSGWMKHNVRVYKPVRTGPGNTTDSDVGTNAPPAPWP